MNRWLIFTGGAIAGGIIASVVKTAGFRKACAKAVEKGIELKEAASAFVETMKEDAEDIVAEAKSNSEKKAKA